MDDTDSNQTAIMNALAVLQNVSLQEAKKIFLSGPDYNCSVVEEFNKKTDKQLRKEGISFNHR